MDHLNYFIENNVLHISPVPLDKSFIDDRIGIQKYLKNSGGISLGEIEKHIENTGIRIEKIVIEGDWKQVPPKKSFIIRPDDSKAMLINSDFKYSVMREMIVPLTRNIHNDVARIVLDRKVIFFIDRPLQYHLDALYIYSILEKYYDIYVWRDKNDDALLAAEYEMIIHFGHANGICFKIGDYSIERLPKANIMFSYGCCGANAFMNIKHDVLSFCGFAYACYGQRPGSGSNELLTYVIIQMIRGASLANAVANAKRWYVDVYGIKLGINLPQYEVQFEAAVNLLALCSLNDYVLLSGSKYRPPIYQCLSIEKELLIELPNYDATLLVEIRIDSLYQERLQISDCNRKNIDWKNANTGTYMSLSGKRYDFMSFQTDKAVFLLLNKYRHDNKVQRCVETVYYQFV